MEFNQILDKCLIEKGLSNYKLAKDINVSDSLVGYWRKGDRKPTLENLLILSGYLNVSVDYLITGREYTSQMLAKDVSTNKDENELIENYRYLDNRGKHKLHTVTYEELDRMERESSQAILKQVNAG